MTIDKEETFKIFCNLMKENIDQLIILNKQLYEFNQQMFEMKKKFENMSNINNMANLASFLLQKR